MSMCRSNIITNTISGLIPNRPFINKNVANLRLPIPINTPEHNNKTLTV